MEFKDILRTRRKELDMTLEEVGKKVGVTKATVQRWESGAIKNLSQDKIAALAAALQISPEYLLGWTEDPSTVFNSNMATALADLTEEEANSVLHYIAFLKSQRRSKK